MVITGVKNGSPDMILTAFDGKFDEKKDEIPPRACRPPNKLKKTISTKWTTNKLKKNNVEKVRPKKLKKNNVEKLDGPQSPCWVTTRPPPGRWPRAVSLAVPKGNPHRLASRVASPSPHQVKNGTYNMPMVCTSSWVVR